MLYKETVEPNTLALLNALVKKDYLNGFYLVGGTALSLQMGHRKSYDLDFFSFKAFDSQEIAENIERDFSNTIRVGSGARENTLNMLIQGVKVDFIRYNYPLIDDVIEDESVKMYGAKDIAAMKLSAISNRGLRKDFYDMHELLTRFELKDLLASYKKKFKQSDYSYVLRSLLYFEDAELSSEKVLSIKEVSWSEVKRLISDQVNKLLL